MFDRFSYDTFFSTRKLAINIVVLFNLINLFIPRSIYAKLNQYRCNSNTFKEASYFLEDYLQCIKGDKEKCNSIYDYAIYGKTVTGVMNLFAQSYIAKRVLNMSATTLRDAQKNASDYYYLQELKRQLGGKEIDQILKQHNGDKAAAIQAIETQISNLNIGQTPTSKANIKISELEEVKGKLKLRLKFENQNNSRIEFTLNRTNELNKMAIKNLNDLDDNLSRLDQKLKNQRHFLSLSETDQIKKRIQELESIKKQQLSQIAVVETNIKTIAEKYNDQMSQLITQMESNLKSEANSDKKRRIKNSIKSLKNKLIKVPSEKINQYSRLILGGGSHGLSLVDINGRWSRLPPWSQELRISDIKALPELIRNAITKRPDFANDLDQLIAYVSRLEHHRYRKFTLNHLVQIYNKDQLIQSKNEFIQSQIKSIQSSNFSAALSSNQSIPPTPIDASQKLPDEVQKKFLNYKDDWNKVNVAFSKLDVDNKSFTTNAVSSFFAKYFPGASSRNFFKPHELTLLKRPIYGKIGARLTKVGLGWGPSVGLLWYDAYDYYDLAQQLLFMNKYTTELIWDKVDPNCRMPDEIKLGNSHPYRKAADYFCHCQSNDTPFEKLPTECQKIPSLIDYKIKKVCDLAKTPGRDRDLFIAKAYSQTSNDQQTIINILKSSVGCEVMKNQRSNCRFSTDKINAQGLYYLTLIKDNDLFNSVSDLCPDVCQHWIDIAKNKADELSKLETIKSLPSTKLENKPLIETCDKDYTKGPPPSLKSANDFWKRCQPKIVCLSDAKIRINIAEHRRYEIELDKYSLTPRRITHHILHTSGSKEAYIALGIQNPLVNQIQDRKNFMYSFDEDGTLSSLVLFNSDNSRSESIGIDEFDALLKEKAYNTMSDRDGLILERFSTEKRLEMFLATDKAVEYCCNNEINCNENLNTPSPLNTLMDLNQEVK